MSVKKETDIKDSVSNFPETPGIYKFLDKNDKTIYVGKAKNIKKRVTSYFTKKHENFKTKLLVRKIAKIEYIVVETESDALLLENNLIKKLQPTYNVMLKDDKTYPWIVVKNENFPRVFYTRQKINDGSKYFGPFTSVYMVKTLLNLVKQLYPLRTCRHKLSPENIKADKFVVCLEYHIHNCLGPCEGKIKEEAYLKFIEDAEKIIRGDIHIIQDYLNSLMNEFASEYKFEEAAKIKEKLDIIENYKSKSTIVNYKITDLDVFSIISDVNSSYVNYLKVQNGSVIQAHTIELKKKIEESEEELFPMAIFELRKSLGTKNKKAIVPFIPGFNIDGLEWIVPQRGDKKKLLELSQRNAKFHMLEKHKHIEKTNPERHSKRKLETLKADLVLDKLPEHIECFDISQIQGTNIAASCIVFKNAKPAKKEYRHYNINTVEGQDDYASIREVVYRRYEKLIKDKAGLPDLIIIDGGKGQLNAAIDSLKKLGIYGKSAIIGIAKRLEEIFVPGDPVPIYLDKNSESLKLIQQARNEAHRFVITFHRQKRSSGSIKSELEKIPGIGPKTIKALLTEFKSVEKIKKTDKKKIEELIGKNKAEIIIKHMGIKK